MFVTVASADFREFIEELSPEYRFTCDYSNGDLEIEFSAPEDYKRALEWVYAKYPSDIYGKGGKLLGTIFFDAENDYWYSCNLDNHEEYGFSTSEKAEGALIEYCGNDA